MKYFSAIKKRADELNVAGQAYLDKLPFMSNDDVAERLYKKAQEIFKQQTKQWGTLGAWEHVPDWVADIMDGYIPYYYIPRNGSIYFSLGFAQTAQDALLRNSLEYAEGREKFLLELPCVAEKEVVEKYCNE